MILKIFWNFLRIVKRSRPCWLYDRDCFFFRLETVQLTSGYDYGRPAAYDLDGGNDQDFEHVNGVAASENTYTTSDTHRHQGAPIDRPFAATVETTKAVLAAISDSK